MKKGDTDRLFAAEKKMPEFCRGSRSKPPPAGTNPEAWKGQQQHQLESIKDNQDYIEQSLMNAAFQQKDAAKKASLLVRFANLFPDSPKCRAGIGRGGSHLPAGAESPENDRNREQRAGKRPGQYWHLVAGRG